MTVTKKLTIKIIENIFGLIVVNSDKHPGVCGVTTLDKTGEGLMVFVEAFSEELLCAINKSDKKGLYILNKEYKGKVTIPAVFTSNVRHTYSEICKKLFNYDGGYWDLDSDLFESPKIGHRTKIMQGVHISNGARVGSDSIIFPGVYIGPKVVIGDNVVIKSNTVIGQPGFGVYETPCGKLKHMPHVGSVIIGSYCEIGALNTICAGTIHPTMLGNAVMTDDHVHIAHNCKVGSKVFIAAHAEISGSVVIGDNAWLSPNIAILNGVSIGANSFIGIGATVTKSVANYERVAGKPARKIV